MKKSLDSNPSARAGLYAQNRLNKFYPEYFYTKKAPLIRSELKVDPRRYERALKHVVAARQSQALKAMLSDLQGLKKLLDD